MYKRLMIVYVAIIIVMAFLVGFLTNRFINIYYYEREITKMENSVPTVEKLIKEYIDGNIIKKQLDFQLKFISMSSDVNMIFMPSAQYFEKERPNEFIYFNRTIDIESFPQLANDIKRRPSPFLENKRYYSEDLNENVVLYSAPLYVDGNKVGTIVEFTFLEDIDKLLIILNRRIYMISFLVMIAGFIIFGILSKKFTDPLKRVSREFKKLADGEFANDLEISSYGEIDNLVKSFNYMKGELEKTEEIRRNLVSNVSHELRNPLTSILGYVHAMKDGIAKKDDIKRYYDIIIAEIERLNRMIQDLLETSKYQDGKVNLKISEFSLRELANNLKDEFDILLKGRTLNISNDETLCEIEADYDKIKQVFINILSNAIKHTEENGNIDIDIKCKKDTVNIVFSDSGKGIPKEEIDKIFDKFHKVDKSRNPAIGGTGLGLSIVKHIIKLHGGKIWAESELGKGTHIHIKLPRKNSK